jgi:Xaa-Pro aminopeptidase
MFLGKSSADKLKDLRKQLEDKNASAMVVSMLDEIAWLFNLRASDISYNPGGQKFHGLITQLTPFGTS